MPRTINAADATADAPRFKVRVRGERRASTHTAMPDDGGKKRSEHVSCPASPERKHRAKIQKRVRDGANSDSEEPGPDSPSEHGIVLQLGSDEGVTTGAGPDPELSTSAKDLVPRSGGEGLAPNTKRLIEVVKFWASANESGTDYDAQLMEASVYIDSLVRNATAARYAPCPDLSPPASKS